MHILPVPVHYEFHEGVIDVQSGDVAAVVSKSDHASNVADYLRAHLPRCSLDNTPNESAAKLKINLCIVDSRQTSFDRLSSRYEAYEMVVCKASSGQGIITISSPAAQGLFWGVQSLLQILTRSDGSGHEPLKLRSLRILDYPRFMYRGALLDVGRHWFSVAFIKKFIDLLALHKLNVFHWHLTEDQGWRIEIQSHPRLTEHGAYRGKGDARYGGFYTQAEIREVVQYAAERFVEVVPEIEMPGHCCAALACYPELSCTGEVAEVPTQWGVQTDVYCAGKERTFEFLQAVLEEVMELFPSRYIHIGGDECPKTRWAECEACQRRIREQKLSGTEQLQTYFINRIAAFLRERGRCIIGWDEVLEGGAPEEGSTATGDAPLAADAIVMSWRGTLGGIAAAKHKHRVIMTPNTRCYLDYRQSASLQEPGTWYAVLPLEWVYMFDPCCKMGQLDMRVVDGDAGKGQAHSGMQTTADTVEKEAACSQAVARPGPGADGGMRSASSISDMDAVGIQSALHSSSATTPSHVGDDCTAIQSGTSAALADSADDDTVTAAAAEAQAEAMTAHLALGLDIHDEQYIMGGQGNLWTEFIADEITAEYMLIPRLCALSECLWSPASARNWRAFLDRTSALLPKLANAGYNYRPLVSAHDQGDQDGSIMQ
eukprot:jgi/Ulvmu1/4078/UM019_0056.1